MGQKAAEIGSIVKGPVRWVWARWTTARWRLGELAVS